MKNNFIAMIIVCAMIMAASKTEAQTNLQIGSLYMGGTVAYLLKPGDPGYDPTMQHGLLASKSDITEGPNSQFVWCPNSGKTGATMNTLHDGMPNTALILMYCPAPGVLTAARVCHNYGTPEVPADWYLPDAYELNLLYVNRAAIGGFSPNPYWSSNESSPSQARALNFGTGTWYDGKPKSQQSRVRAIHVF